MPSEIPGHRIPLSILASIDPVLRDAAIFGLVTDTPRAVALRHDIRDDDGTLRRVVVDATGVVEDTILPIEHACLSCAVREDALPTLRALAADGRWDHVLLALPVAAASLPVTRALSGATGPGGELESMRLATVLAVVDLDSAETDLLDDDLLEERGIALTRNDQRAVGEALAAQLEHVDLVVTTSDTSVLPSGAAQDAAGDAERGSHLVDRLRAAGSERIDGLHAVDILRLSAATHDAAIGERRAHPLGARVDLPDDCFTPSNLTDPTWTLELVSDRPFHPERLLDQIQRLGTGRLRSRGVFWVPNRPDSLCAWDGAGGQLSIGELGPWDHAALKTWLVFTGTVGADGSDERAELRAAFDELLATPEEIADGGLQWLGREDVLAPWLGARSDAV